MIKFNPKTDIPKYITRMTKADAIEAVATLEATVTIGRTVQAYKRGGWDEARERGIEETTGALVWLTGVNIVNKLGDKILEKFWGANKSKFDVGTDKVLRTPFDNYMKKMAPKNYSAKTIALMKSTKVLASVLLADMFIGLVVPKVNHSITNILRSDSKTKRLENASKQEEKQIKNPEKIQQNPSFKGAINVFTNVIEKTNTGKLLSTDAGLISGRLYSARNNDERREIAIRDISSIYFYMWAQRHVGNVLNFIEMGKFNRLNPATTALLDKQLQAVVDSKNGSMTKEEFKNLVLGKNSSEIILPENIKFEKAELSAIDKLMNKFGAKNKALEVVEVNNLNSFFDAETLKRIKEMSKLQPKRNDVSVITKEQLIDAINNSKINDPKFLNKVYSEFTGGANTDPYRFVSEQSLRDLKQQMVEYVELICEQSKDGKITKDFLEKMKTKNLHMNGANFAAGFVFAAAFLSTLIPKFQYWVTRQKTGVNEFPGIKD